MRDDLNNLFYLIISQPYSTIYCSKGGLIFQLSQLEERLAQLEAVVGMENPEPVGVACLQSPTPLCGTCSPAECGIWWTRWREEMYCSKYRANNLNGTV